MIPEKLTQISKCDVLTGNGSLFFKSLKPCNLGNCTKDEIKDYFNNSYDLYESLFTSINYEEAYYLCPDRLRLPLIFYYGHTACVYMNKLVLAGLLEPEERINFEFDTLFETGVDEMSWDDLEHFRMGGEFKWPSVEQVHSYRLQVRKLINKVIDRTEIKLPINWDNKLWSIFMGMEHERIHYETSSVLIRQYPIEFVNKPFGWTYGPVDIKTKIENCLVKVDKSEIEFGKSYDFPSYGWDNEYGKVKCVVDEFEASKYKITNEEFYEFVKENGYDRKDFWSEEGWQWVRFKEAKHPLFWVCPFGCKSGCGGAIASYSHCNASLFNQNDLEQFKHVNKNKIPFKLRLMFDIIEMPKNWPVEVNYHEAKAFCKWKGDQFRLLTEAEHNAIRDTCSRRILSIKDDIIYKFDPENVKVNHNMAFGSSTPVDMFKTNEKGFNDVFGNVWEWVEDNFNGLPGGKTHYLYDDFSTPCYDGRHNLIMGGSWISTGDEASHFARFMFRRHFYQHCGFRLSRSLVNDSKEVPNPQVRLIEDKIYLLGYGYQENILLDEKQFKLNFYRTENKQYLLDSHLDTNSLFSELIHEYEFNDYNSWFNEFIEIKDLYLDEYKVNKDIALHFGASTGRISFELARKFNQVIAVDFCAKYLSFCIELQKNGFFKLEKYGKIKVDKSTADKVIFKQMTWIPNEIPKSNFVLFTMIDRVENYLSWVKRFKEITKKMDLLLFIRENQNSVQNRFIII